MLKYSKHDDLVASYLEDDKIWEVILITTFEKQEGEEVKHHTYTVKTFDTDLDRASEVLHKSALAYFTGIGNIMFE